MSSIPKEAKRITQPEVMWKPSAMGVKHLGITVTNCLDGCQKDVMSKRARFIQRSNELLQEFHFAHTDTKVKLNTVYNSHFSGSNCWDLTGRACEMFEATFNRNIKLTFDLPYPTHRNLLPVISELKPLRITQKSFENLRSQYLEKC